MKPWGGSARGRGQLGPLPKPEALLRGHSGVALPVPLATPAVALHSLLLVGLGARNRVFAPSVAPGQGGRRETLPGAPASSRAHLGGAAEEPGLVLLVEGDHGAHVLLRHQLRAQAPSGTIRHRQAPPAWPGPPRPPYPAAASPQRQRAQQHGAVDAVEPGPAGPGQPRPRRRV